MRRQPGAGVRREWGRRARERGIVDPEVARFAAIDPPEVWQPDLAQAANAGRLRELVGVLDVAFELPEAGLRRPPLRRLFVKQHPRKDQQERDAEPREQEMQPERRDIPYFHGHTHAQFGPRKNVPMTISPTKAAATAVKIVFAIRRSGANHRPEPDVPRSR